MIQKPCTTLSQKCIITLRERTGFKSSRSQTSVFKKFVNSRAKHLCLSLFLIKLNKKRFQYRCQKQPFVDFSFQKFPKLLRKTFVLSHFLIKLNKKKLQCKCFPVNLTKFLRTPFSTVELKWLLLRFNFCFQVSGTKTYATVSNTYQIQLKKVFAATKIQKQLRYMFCKRRPTTLLKKAPVLPNF